MGTKRYDELQTKLRRHSLRFDLLYGVVFLVIGVHLGSRLFDGGRDYFMNLFTEAMGVVGTVILVNRWYGHRREERQAREEERQLQERKRRLAREAGSRSNDIAIAALEQLSDNRWLEGDDGLLKGAFLSKASLQNARLSRANLEGSRMWNANLLKADLYDVNLQGAELRGANLKEATLFDANLQGADLRLANLQDARMSKANLRESDLVEANLQDAGLLTTDMQGAVLRHANLQGAKMWEANLQGADLRYANLQEAYLSISRSRDNQVLDKVAILPDGTNYSEDTDMGKFTDPNHPEFDATLVRINEIRKAMKLDDIRLPK